MSKTEELVKLQRCNIKTQSVGNHSTNDSVLSTMNCKKKETNELGEKRNRKLTDLKIYQPITMYEHYLDFDLK